MMLARALLPLTFLLAACSASESSTHASTSGSTSNSTSDSTSFTPSQVAAIRDSVRAFLDAYAADVSAPPIGKKAREALAPFYAPEIVMSTDLAPNEPIMVQTLDSLVPADEVVSEPAWIRSTKFTWGTTVITPLAPGLATFTGKYAEHVTDTTGTTTDLPGVQHGVVRHGANGWRFITVQSSHPMTTHTRQAELAKRFSGGK